MISGTLQTSLNLGPINGHIWTRGPRIYGFYYTRILQKRLESIWGHLGNMLFSISENQQIRKCSNVCVPQFYCYFLHIFDYIIYKLYFTKMRIGSDIFH